MPCAIERTIADTVKLEAHDPETIDNGVLKMLRENTAFSIQTTVTQKLKFITLLKHLITTIVATHAITLPTILRGLPVLTETIH